MNIGDPLDNLIRCLALCVLALPLLGQVTARQGTPADLQQSRFASPMVLELPAERLRAAEPEDIYTFTDLDKFVCEDASLPLVVIKKLTGKPEKVALRIESTVYLRPSFDRRVILRYSLVQGGKVLAAAPEQLISAKENKYRSENSTLLISKEAFEQWFQGEGRGILKVVVIVEPDR